MNALRQFPATGLGQIYTPAGGNMILDLTARPRLGLRGPGTPDWCAANSLPFPDAINGVSRHGGLRIARLGTYELLILSDGSTPLPAAEHPQVYSGYRDETWSWFRMIGPALLETIGRLTSADLRPSHAARDSVHQTRFGGLDAVLLVDEQDQQPALDIFTDIASVDYLLGVFQDRCPGFLR